MRPEPNFVPRPGHSPRDRSLSVTFVGADEPDSCIRSPATTGGRARTTSPVCSGCRNGGLAMISRSDGATKPRARSTRRPSRDRATHGLPASSGIGGVDPRGTAAELYLKSRGLALTNDACAVLRFHPTATWRVDPDHPEFPAGRHPTLLAAFQDIETDEVTGIDRIRVDQPRLWPRTRRKMLGRVSGSAVKLDDVPHGVLAVGEGIETAMAANQMGFGPAWALGSAGAIATLPVLEDIRKLILLGENDDASRRATEQCAQRWLRAGREVELVEPEVGTGPQ